MPLAAKMITEKDGVTLSNAGNVDLKTEIVFPKLRLSSRQVPPGGLSYKIAALAEKAPREAWVGPFNALETLYSEVRKRCMANGIAVPSYSDVENDVCQRLQPGYCRDESGHTTTHPGVGALSLHDVREGTKALVGWFKHGSVPVEETIRRTYICNDCPENVPIAGCQGCAANTLYSIINAIVVKPLPSDAVLGACGICKCSLKAKTRMKLDDLPAMSAEQKARLPEKCWIIAEATARDNDPRI